MGGEHCVGSLKGDIAKATHKPISSANQRYVGIKKYD
jgi:hypothetical protein